MLSPGVSVGSLNPQQGLNLYTILSLLNYESCYAAAFGNYNSENQDSQLLQTSNAPVQNLRITLSLRLTPHNQFVSKSFWLEVKLVPCNTAIWITSVIPYLALLFLATSPTPSLVSHNSQSGPLETVKSYHFCQLKTDVWP